MDHSTEQDKGISAAKVTESLKCAGATVQENLEKAGATISEQVDKFKAKDDEDKVAAGLTKDTRQAAATDRADAKKEQYHKEASGGGESVEHPPPFTKTPFV